MTTYVSLFIGMVLLAGLYFSMKWERGQYEEIDEVMTGEEDEDHEIEEIPPDEDFEDEPDKIWEGSIEGVHTKLYKGWQRQIYVVVEQGFPFSGRVESTNFLRSTTRFFKEMVTSRMRVWAPGTDSSLLAYSTRPEPMERLLSIWSEPEHVEKLQRIHHVEFDEDEFTAQFFHPEIDLEELTEKARTIIDLFRAIPDGIKKDDGNDRPDHIPDSEGTDTHGSAETNYPANP